MEQPIQRVRDLHPKGGTLVPLPLLEVPGEQIAGVSKKQIGVLHLGRRPRTEIILRDHAMKKNMNGQIIKYHFINLGTFITLFWGGVHLHLQP